MLIFVNSESLFSIKYSQNFEHFPPIYEITEGFTILPLKLRITDLGLYILKVT